ncbi:uncharacterized protein LOC121408418 [Lytechinus variegatus]|uniref:uncharacterized protein LOC121408418 n=1 Tax=Lytechinus variegatus TaxID=7654 RepID=UPI001BB11CB9|nr:uncharacterized protein LOC121408418 [Lytechinus variegatus]
MDQWIPVRTPSFCDHNNLVRSISIEPLVVRMRSDVNLDIYFDPNVNGILKESGLHSINFDRDGDVLTTDAYYSDKGFRIWTLAEVSSGVLLVELDPKFVPSDNNKTTVQKRIEKVRYHRDKVNGSYYGGDVHSWQRYTRQLPLACQVTIDRDAHALFIQSDSSLQSGKWYAIVLQHRENHCTCSTDIYHFHFANPECIDRYEMDQGLVISDAVLPFRYSQTKIRVSTPATSPSPSLEETLKSHAVEEHRQKMKFLEDEQKIKLNYLEEEQKLKLEVLQLKKQVEQRKLDLIKKHQDAI